jgi:hypothetical protein
MTVVGSNHNAQGVFGAVEVDDDDVALFLLGAAWSPGGLGWKPFGSVVGYNLQLPGDFSRNVVVPTIGLINMQQTQSLSLGIGYAFADDDDVSFLAPVSAPSGDGVVASFGWDYWGSGNRMAQLLGSFNFGDEFLWTRGRAAVPLSQTSPLWVGGEAALLGGGDPSFYIAQFGPMVEWRFNPQFRLGASGGLKVGVSNASGSAAYGRLEFLWLPRAR